MRKVSKETREMSLAQMRERQFWSGCADSSLLIGFVILLAAIGRGPDFHTWASLRIPTGVFAAGLVLAAFAFFMLRRAYAAVNAALDKWGEEDSYYTSMKWVGIRELEDASEASWVRGVMFSIGILAAVIYLLW